MLIVALRHIVGELCINALFDRIARNFNKSVSIDVIKVGDFFHRICNRVYDEVYINCTVTAIVDVVDINGISNGHQFVYIKYDKFIDAGDVYTMDDMDDMSDMTDDELDEYLAGFDDGDDDITDMSDDDDIDYTDIDLIDDITGTVGLNTEYHEFYR